MAKPPKIGSKGKITEFVTKKITKSNSLKVIQPAVISYFDETYYWIVRIIFVGVLDQKVGITRKIEAGYALVSETEKGKITMLDLRISKELMDHIDANSG